MNETVESAFRPAKESVSWAHEAINEFDVRARAFFCPDRREIITDIDPQTLKSVHKLRLKEPLPLELTRKATEALTRTKEAFDQATFAARKLLSGPPRKSVYFPWACSPTDLIRLLEERGLDKRLWDLFESYQPYPTGNSYSGGSDVIRALATLANRKHTIGLVVQPSVTFMMHPIQGDVVMRYFMPPVWDAVKNEAVIATWERSEERRVGERV